jgi:chemotaxis protein CheY-P-specific phosphatase CheC
MPETGNVNPEANNPNLEAVQEAVNTLASAFHEQWRETRKQEDGNFEPRIKDTTDEEWSNRNNGATVVDIANTPFDQLPADWQAENAAAATVVVEMLLEDPSLLSADLKDEETRGRVGTTIHNAWLARNSWAKENEVLGRPFAELPEGEADKDIAQLETAIAIFGSQE